MKTFANSLLVLSILVHPIVIRAEWQPNGTALSVVAGNQSAPISISDGAGGAIVTWTDNRNGNQDIYAQRINASGTVQWTPDGVALCTATNSQEGPSMVSDGAGGAIVTWTDYRGGQFGDIYAQRVDASGVVQWTADGIAVCTAESYQGSATSASDGAGGAIIAWMDLRYSPDLLIVVQRVNASGVVQWATDGIVLVGAVDYQSFPAILPDGIGGAILAWSDYRNDVIFQDEADIFAQRVDGSGVKQWPSDAVLASGESHQNQPVMTSDGVGGAIVAWYDYSFGVAAQRVNAAGAVQWTGGIFVPSLLMATDGAGGAIWMWLNYLGGEFDIFAQRVNASGVVQWTAPLCTAAGDQLPGMILSDGGGGAIASWSDSRNGDPDIYAQRVNAAGAVEWTIDGVALCTVAGDQVNPTSVSDGVGGAITSWADYRSLANFDVYAQRVGSNGMIPTAIGDRAPTASLIVGNNHPNPFSTTTEIDMQLYRESSVEIDVFDAAGRRVRVIDMGRKSAGAVHLVFDGLDDRAHELASGVYFLRINAGAETVTKKIVIAR